MAIVKRYGQAGLAQLGVEAGKARAAKAADALGAQIAIANINQAGATQRAEIGAISSAGLQRNKQQFDSFMAMEGYKRQKAWDIEKLETRQRFELEQELVRENSQQQLRDAQDLKEQQELKVKTDAIDRALDEGTITADQASQAKFKLDTGLNLPQAPDPIERALDIQNLQRGAQALERSVTNEVFDLEEYTSMFEVGDVRGFEFGPPAQELKFIGADGDRTTASPQQVQAFRLANERLQALSGTLKSPAQAILPVVQSEYSLGQRITRGGQTYEVVGHYDGGDVKFRRVD